MESGTIDSCLYESASRVEKAFFGMLQCAPADIHTALAAAHLCSVSKMLHATCTLWFRARSADELASLCADTVKVASDATVVHLGGLTAAGEGCETYLRNEAAQRHWHLFCKALCDMSWDVCIECFDMLGFRHDHAVVPVLRKVRWEIGHHEQMPNLIEPQMCLGCVKRRLFRVSMDDVLPREVFGSARPITFESGKSVFVIGSHAEATIRRMDVARRVGLLEAHADEHKGAVSFNRLRLRRLDMESELRTLKRKLKEVRRYEEEEREERKRRRTELTAARDAFAAEVSKLGL